MTHKRNSSSLQRPKNHKATNSPTNVQRSKSKKQLEHNVSSKVNHTTEDLTSDRGAVRKPGNHCIPVPKSQRPEEDILDKEIKAAENKIMDSSGGQQSTTILPKIPQAVAKSKNTTHQLSSTEDRFFGKQQKKIKNLDKEYQKKKEELQTMREQGPSQFQKPHQKVPNHGNDRNTNVGQKGEQSKMRSSAISQQAGINVFQQNKSYLPMSEFGKLKATQVSESKSGVTS